MIHARVNKQNECMDVLKWIKLCLLPCFGKFKMTILMFISILVFRPEGQIWNPVTHLPITRMRNRDQYRMFIRGVSGLALEESKVHFFSRI